MSRLPFKGFASRQDYPPTGLSTDLWKREVQLDYVTFAELWLIQDGVLIAPLFDDRLSPESDHYPHAVRHDDRLFLEDGHHRVVRCALRGNYGMIMRVYDPPLEKS